MQFACRGQLGEHFFAITEIPYLPHGIAMRLRTVLNELFFLIVDYSMFTLASLFLEPHMTPQPMTHHQYVISMYR